MFPVGEGYFLLRLFFLINSGHKIESTIGKFDEYDYCVLLLFFLS